MDVDESVLSGEDPSQYVTRLARTKANACDDACALILAADTTVALKGAILGKPIDRADARRMLTALSGQTHDVFTAVCIRRGEIVREVLVRSSVSFAELSQDTISAYLLTDEPWDKAGGYGIQGMAGSFVRAIHGS